MVSDQALKEPALADDPGGVEAVSRLRRLAPKRVLLATIAAACMAAVAAVVLGSSAKTAPQGARPAARKVAAAPKQPTMPPPLKPHPTAVQATAPGQGPPAGVTAGPRHGAGTPRPPSDAEVRSELSDFREHLKTVGTPQGPIAKVLSDGTAVAPNGVPGVVLAVVAAGNEIAKKPYKWGGGHGAWRDSGYDCSGSVSFALAGAGLLDHPLDSTGFMHWGAPGRGRWITILANPGHAFMVVAGLRFDTSGARGGTRWQPANGRSYGGFVMRHPPGL